MAEDKDTEVEVETEEGNEFYLGNWKTREAAKEGLKNMQTKFDDQGTEVGTLRKQVEFAQQTIDDLKNQQATPAPQTNSPDYSKELGDIQSEISKLDPDDEGYQRQLTTFMNKSNSIVSKMTKEETLAAATAAFKAELNDRDVKATYSAFYRDNPDFSTPEMQMQIKEYIAKDTTGMSDELVAYREIQRDTATQAAKALEAENIELKRIVELAKGTTDTGRVITKSQTPPQTKQPKAVGADLDKGMQESLNALRG